MDDPDSDRQFVDEQSSTAILSQKLTKKTARINQLKQQRKKYREIISTLKDAGLKIYNEKEKLTTDLSKVGDKKPERVLNFEMKKIFSQIMNEDEELEEEGDENDDEMIAELTKKLKAGSKKGLDSM